MKIKMVSMKSFLSLLATSRHGYIHMMMALILLINLVELPFVTPVQAAGTNCISSGPSGGAYTVTPCFTSPAHGVTVNGNRTVSVNATVVGNSSGISKLIFYINGQYLITDFQSPYTFVLPTTKWVDGSKVLSVAVTMKDGFISQTSSITLTFNNGITTTPVNHSSFTPTSGTTPKSGQPLVLAAVGDGAGGETNATNVTSLIASWKPNLFLFLGDVYEKGSPAEFYNWYGTSNQYFSQFRAITDPVVGNHEYTNGAAPGYFDYWNNIPSYYSYDSAGWHFIALNSNCVLKICAPGQTEYQWLQNDLTTHSNICTIAYYHHPVYNIGQEGYATAMNNIWALMAQHGVDIVLNGHEHDYQRWEPLDGNGVASRTGITEFIAGGGGHGITPFITTDSRMVIGYDNSPNTFGALRLELNQYGANYQYINYQGTVLDSGVVPCSGAPADKTAPAIPSNLVATSSSSNVNLSWNASTDNVGVAAYDIYRDGSMLTSVGPVSSYSDTNVSLGATYQYRVKARDAAGNVSGFSSTATATIPSLLFSDGFESGKLSAWSTVTNLALQQQDVYSGTYAARATSSGSAASYASMTFSAVQSNLYYNEWFKINSRGSTSAYLERFRTGTNGAIAGILVTSTGKLGYRNEVAKTNTTSSITVTQNVWHQLDAHLQFNGASSLIEVWYDGAQVAALSRTDNFGTNAIGGIQLGDLQSTDVYNIDFDDISANASFINTGSVSTPTPGATNTPSVTPTRTDTPGSGATNTSTATATRTNTPTPGASNTPTATLTSTATNTTSLSQTFTPVADAYVDSSNPGTNYGASTALRVDSSPVLNSYLRFTVQNLGGRSISRVRLLIYANSSSSEGITSLTVADNTWGERTITASNAPAMGSTLAASSAVAAGTWITLDVTSYVNGEGTFNFGLSTAGQTAISLAARELGAHSPQLIVDLQ